jgi:hypothetical protein
MHVLHMCTASRSYVTTATLLQLSRTYTCACRDCCALYAGVRVHARGLHILCSTALTVQYVQYIMFFSVCSRHLEWLITSLHYITESAVV